MTALRALSFAALLVTLAGCCGAGTRLSDKWEFRYDEPVLVGERLNDEHRKKDGEARRVGAAIVVALDTRLEDHFKVFHVFELTRRYERDATGLLCGSGIVTEKHLVSVPHRPSFFPETPPPDVLTRAGPDEAFQPAWGTRAMVRWTLHELRQTAAHPNSGVGTMLETGAIEVTVPREWVEAGARHGGPLTLRIAVEAPPATFDVVLPRELFQDIVTVPNR